MLVPTHMNDGAVRIGGRAMLVPTTAIATCGGVGAGRAGGLDMTRQRWTLAGISKRGTTPFGRLNEGCPEGGEIRNLPPLVRLC